MDKLYAQELIEHSILKELPPRYTKCIQLLMARYAIESRKDDNVYNEALLIDDTLLGNPI